MCVVHANESPRVESEIGACLLHLKPGRRERKDKKYFLFPPLFLLHTPAYHHHSAERREESGARRDSTNEASRMLKIKPKRTYKQDIS